MFLVRHGETEFNRAGRIQGRLDSPLTPTGVTQAKAIGRHLKALIGPTTGWTIQTSPLGRAVATAGIIRAQTGIRAELILDDRLREVSLGSWDGLSRADIDARWPGVLGASLRHSWAQSCPDGESIDAVLLRLADWLQAHTDHRTLIVVSHGITGSLLRGLYAKLPRDTMLSLPTPQDSFQRLADGAVQDVAVPGLQDLGSPPRQQRLI
ncbi:MAG: histidine phosphatase family protein [Proteobacteria bacterium]|nr:histidine phosphatase family protein [Pseudomonadota bacterium]